MIGLNAVTVNCFKASLSEMLQGIFVTAGGVKSRVIEVVSDRIRLCGNLIGSTDKMINGRSRTSGWVSPKVDSASAICWKAASFFLQNLPRSTAPPPQLTTHTEMNGELPLSPQCRSESECLQILSSSFQVELFSWMTDACVQNVRTTVQIARQFPLTIVRDKKKPQILTFEQQETILFAVCA